MSSINNIKKLFNQIKERESDTEVLSEASFEIGSGHKSAQKTQKLYNKGSRTDNPNEKQQFLKRTGPQLPMAKAKPSMQVSGYELEGDLVSEREMTDVEMKKEKKLKNKYDASEMKKSMVDQYGKEKGTQIYFAKIRKMAMEECECEGQEVEEKDKKEKIDPREMPTKVNLIKNKLRSMGLKMGYEPDGEQIDEIAPLAIGAGVAAAAAAPYLMKKFAKPAVDKAINKPATGSGSLVDKMKQRRDATNAAIQQLRQSFDYDDAYDYIIEMLVAADFAEDYEAAEVMFEHISDEFTATILEEYIEEKARGTRKKTTVHAYDVDETLFGHGKKGKPNVQVHVKDSSGKRVKSLSNQEFNTHKLDKDHSYDFSEFQSAKKFKETSSPNKKVVKDIKRKQARGQNVHLITARSKFDKPSEFQGHLKKHGVDVDKKNIHYTGGMKGGDIGKKKVDVANAVAKQSGAKKTHMYDDAAKVHKAFEKEKSENPTSKTIKTHMVAPDKSGESRVKSFQATKGGTTGGPEKTTKQTQRARKKARKNMGEEMGAYDYWKQFID